MSQNPTTSTRQTQAERTATTRAALVAAGRELFTEPGYAAVGTSELCERAGVSRGALYHHFDDKVGLFAAVCEAVEVEVSERIILRVAEAADSIDELRIGASAWLDACAEADVRRILLVDGPAVLGWAAWRDLTARYGLGLTEALLAQGVGSGTLKPLPARTTAHLVVGALNEAALLIADSDDPAGARAEVEDYLRVLVDSLRS